MSDEKTDFCPVCKKPVNLEVKITGNPQLTSPEIACLMTCPECKNAFVGITANPNKKP
jgi:hypothetical protein